MKQVNQLVEKRKQLQSKLEKFRCEKIDLMDGRTFMELDKEEKSDYMYITGVCNKLLLQIDAITYVVNYDAELEDVTARNPFKRI